jgi:hypothetical protein
MRHRPLVLGSVQDRMTCPPDHVGGALATASSESNRSYQKAFFLRPSLQRRMRHCLSRAESVQIEYFFIKCSVMRDACVIR